MAKAMNPEMLKQGYAPIQMVAHALGKSSSHVHKMVKDKQLVGAKDGSLLYVAVASIEKLYEGHPLTHAVATLRKQVQEALRAAAAS